MIPTARPASSVFNARSSKAVSRLELIDLNLQLRDSVSRVTIEERPCNAQVIRDPVVEVGAEVGDHRLLTVRHRNREPACAVLDAE